MQIIDGIPIWGSPIDEGALAQIKNCAKTAFWTAMMADHHRGYAVPIGGVVAYEDDISPSGVGYDIGCGNKAVLTDANATEVRANIKSIMDEVWKHVSFGVGRNNEEKIDHELFDAPTWSLPMVKPLKQMAQNQLGTVGSGNHYVDIFSDESDRVWIGVHFGSRGLGHKITTFFLNAVDAKDGMDVDPVLFKARSDIGSDYIAAMRLAGDYAYAGRDWVCSRVAKILGASELQSVHNHHNFAWREEHGGKMLWVVRKGATPAFPGQQGFVGGSMGEQSVILEGVETSRTQMTQVIGDKPGDPLITFNPSLWSTIHGAGRVMGRMEAKGKPARPERTKVQGSGKQVIPAVPARPGKVSQAMMDEWVQRAGVELRGAGVDESPHCYKRLPEVLAHHSDSVKILHTLTPIGVAMAGANEFDPFKD